MTGLLKVTSIIRRKELDFQRTAANKYFLYNLIVAVQMMTLAVLKHLRKILFEIYISGLGLFQCNTDSAGAEKLLYIAR